MIKVWVLIFMMGGPPARDISEVAATVYRTQADCELQRAGLKKLIDKDLRRQGQTMQPAWENWARCDEVTVVPAGRPEEVATERAE
jgi:hypothetical protein